MRTDICLWEKALLADIARVTHAARQSKLQDRNISAERLEEMFQENFAETAPPFAVAYSGQELVGLILLYCTSSTSLALNPGQILGGHPVVSPGSDYEQIASGLVQEATDWALNQGIEQIEMVTAMAKNSEFEAGYDRFYQALGFGKEEEYVEMIYHLGQTDRDVLLPRHLQTRPLGDVSVDELYQCYYQAFSAGDANFFFQQNEQEKRETPRPQAGASGRSAAPAPPRGSA